MKENWDHNPVERKHADKCEVPGTSWAFGLQTFHAPFTFAGWRDQPDLPGPFAPRFSRDLQFVVGRRMVVMGTDINSAHLFDQVEIEVILFEIHPNFKSFRFFGFSFHMMAQPWLPRGFRHLVFVLQRHNSQRLCMFTLAWEIKDFSFAPISNRFGFLGAPRSPVPHRLIKQKRSTGIWLVNSTVSFVCFKRLIYRPSVDCFPLLHISCSLSLFGLCFKRRPCFLLNVSQELDCFFCPTFRGAWLVSRHASWLAVTQVFSPCIIQLTVEGLVRQSWLPDVIHHTKARGLLPCNFILLLHLKNPVISAWPLELEMFI